MPDIRPSSSYEVLFEEQEYEGVHEAFDRVGFAMDALEILQPKGVTVAVCSSRARLSVEAGRAWGKRAADGSQARWAVVRIPPHASRRAIALALTELARSAGDARPYALDLLLSPAPFR